MAATRSGAGARRGRLLLALGVAMLATMLVVTVFGPQIAPHSAIAFSPDSLAGPSAEHWLGTDSIGRDVLSRLIIGGRTTLLDKPKASNGAAVAQPAPVPVDGGDDEATVSLDDPNRPQALSAPEYGQKDDLQQISGVGHRPEAGEPIADRRFGRG